jgi:hypothetical protein
MSSQRLIYCDSEILKALAENYVAGKSNRKLVQDRGSRVRAVVRAVEGARREGSALAATLSSASVIITDFYKGRPPFLGDVQGFPIRQALARHALSFLLGHITLVSPTVAHFAEAEKIWLTLCRPGDKSAYAQFSDYVDACYIMNPATHSQFTHVFSGHLHLSYILRRSRYEDCVSVVM